MQFEIGQLVIIKNRKIYERATVLDRIRRKGVNYYDVKTEKGSIIEQVPDLENPTLFLHISMSKKLNTPSYEQEIR